MLPLDARCRGCGYLLRSLPRNVCPECGLAFDPANPLTYRMPRTPWWHVCAGAPGRWHAGLATFSIFVFLHAASLPYQAENGFACLCFPLFALLCCAYALTVIGTVVAMKKVAAYRPPTVHRWRWWATPVALILIVGAGVSEWPLRLRFSLSQRAFEKSVRKAADSSEGRWIGLYHVKAVQVERDGRIGFVTSHSFIDPVGFEYRPRDDGPLRHRVARCWYENEW